MHRICIVCITVVLLFAYQAHAGAWLQQSGHGQMITQTSYYATDTFFDREGRQTAQPAFQKFELQPYVEYGVTPKLTVGATGYLQHVTQSSNSNYGLADPEIFARTLVWKNDSTVVSIQPLIKFKSQFANPNPPQGGSSSNDTELSLLYGKNIDIFTTRDYADMRVGYRYRGGRLNNQWRGDLAFGLELLPDVIITPAVRGIVATRIASDNQFSENGDQDFDLLKMEMGIHYRLASTQMAGITVFDHLGGIQTGDGHGVILSFNQGF